MWLLHSWTVQRNRRKKTSFAKKNRSRFPSIAFSNTLIKKNWENKRTINQNFSSLGLIADPNEISVNKVEIHQPTAVVQTLIEESKVSDEPVRGEFFMTDEEQLYISACIEKHGDDYTKMFRDTKLNFKQHTKTHLQKRCERYKNLKKIQKGKWDADLRGYYYIFSYSTTVPTDCTYTGQK